MSHLVIVESPSKSKTISKYLSDDFVVKSSKGHIRDLAISGKGGLGVDIENEFAPHYVISKDKKDVVKELKACAKKADDVYLATDPDREGEAISWHLAEVLGLDPETTKRVEFHEVTKNAVTKAIDNPRKIDMDLVHYQETRRVLDRIIGFKLSKLLQKKIKSKSAGRVQSVALRLICEREAEIDAERKRYCARLSDEELIKLKGAVNNDSFLKMKNTVQRELAEKKAIVNEACKYQKKGQELSKRGDVLCELITPKRNISIIIVVGVIAGILGIILAVALGKLILDNTPSLWESYQNYGTVINYQVSKRTQLLTKLAVFVPVILIPTIAAWIYSNRDYKKKVDRIPKTREELKIISEQIAENNSIVDALCKAEEEFTFTYDPAKCADIIKEISWKAKYAEEEYNNRHYTEKSVESLIDGLKVAGSDKSSQNEILKSNSNL